MLSDLGRLKSKEGITILGAGVVDDVAAIVIMSVTINVLAGTFSLVDLASVLTKVGIFWAAIIVLVMRILTRVLDRVSMQIDSLTLLALALGFGASFGSAQLGLSTAVGAFAGGLALSNMIRAPEIVERMQPIFLFFVPMFFISIGMLIDPRAFLSSLVPGLLIMALAILAKVLGCAGVLLATKYSLREAFTVGIGMAPRGEVGFILAGMGLASGFIGTEAYLVSIIAVSLTTIVVLPIIKMFFQG
jgi:Kef-type K+ transport system membrane component KefB